MSASDEAAAALTQAVYGDGTTVPPATPALHPPQTDWQGRLRQRLERLWASAKTWRRVPLGPVSLLFRFARAAPRRRRSAGHGTGGISPAATTPMSAMAPVAPRSRLGCVLIVGVGRGVGAAAARYFAERAEGVAIVARRADFLAEVQAGCAGLPAKLRCYPADVTNERETARMLAAVEAELGVPDLVIYAVQTASPGTVLDIEVSAFEDAWRGTCLGAFIVARDVARRMRERGSGTIILLGATSGVVARAGYLNLAVGKHGLRALAHVMARELGPAGIHVVHCIIDADVNEGGPPKGVQMDPRHLAATFHALHEQPESCWTAELDVRPSREAFWQHC